MADPPRPVPAAAPGALRRIWPYPVVVLVGAVLWTVVWGSHLATAPAPAGDDTVVLTFALMVVDVLVGIVTVSLLPLRRRAPLTVAILTAAMLAVSAFATGPAVLAVVHVAVVGSRVGLVVLGGVWTLAGLGNVALLFPALGTGTVTTPELIGLGAGLLLLYLVLVAIGRYRRARAETLALLRERAENAEQRRERDLADARQAERVRIAREMHDVLAHRLSLVSMHAGALSYRDDLPPDRVAEAARVIQDSTALALAELRELLGVLRDTGNEQPHAPQPSLAQLPVLVAEARAAGIPVEAEVTGIGAADDRPVAERLEPSRSRAAYRVVQEALTNAGKHAPGEPVRLRIGRDGDRLTIEARNPMPAATPDVVASGLGLIGLSERVQVAGGGLTWRQSADEFVLTAWMPWP